jgi:hypothetical protein
MYSLNGCFHTCPCQCLMEVVTSTSPTTDKVGKSEGGIEPIPVLARTAIPFHNKVAFDFEPGGAR